MGCNSSKPTEGLDKVKEDAKAAALKESAEAEKKFLEQAEAQAGDLGVAGAQKAIDEVKEQVETKLEKTEEERAKARATSGKVEVEVKKEAAMKIDDAEDVLAAVKEKQRAAHEAMITDEQIDEMVQAEISEAKAKELATDSAAAKAYKKDSLVSHDEIDFVVEETPKGGAKTPNSAFAMKKTEEKKSAAGDDGPILPTSYVQEGDVLAGGS